MSNSKGLPSHAKLVFKGRIFEVWQWEQKMYDGSVEIFERLRRPDTVQVIPVVGDDIITLIQEQPHRKEPFTSLAGGRCGWDEDPLDAAKRELLEETGYISDDWVLWKKQRPVEKMVWTVHTFIARNCAYRQPQELDAGERIEVKPLSFDEFLMLSEDPLFYEKELVGALLRARFNPNARKELHTLLFRG